MRLWKYEHQLNPKLIKSLINEVGVFWKKLEEDIYNFIEKYKSIDEDERKINNR